MRRTTIGAASLLVLSPILLAQQAVKNPGPRVPEGILGSQLVAWSEMQKPRPVLESLSVQPGPSAQQQPRQTLGQAQQQAPAERFTGTISKDGEKYLLKTSDGTVYQLDDPEKAKAYEGKPVRIGGSLDEKTNVLHVTSIEVMP